MKWSAFEQCLCNTLPLASLWFAGVLFVEAPELHMGGLLAVNQLMMALTTVQAEESHRAQRHRSRIR